MITSEKERLVFNIMSFMTHVYDWCCDECEEEKGYFELNEDKWNGSLEVLRAVLDDDDLIYRVEVLMERSGGK